MWYENHVGRGVHPSRFSLQIQRYALSTVGSVMKVRIPHSWFSVGLGLVVGCSVWGTSTVASAQSEGPSAERFFSFIDRNRDGMLDRQEIENAPPNVRDALSGMRTDRGISLRDFEQVMPRITEEFRRRREESSRSDGGGSGRYYGPPGGGSFGGGGFGGGGFGGFSRDGGGESRGGDFRGGGGESRGDWRGSDNRSSGDSGRSSSGSSSDDRSKSSSKRTPPPPKPKVTTSLPDNFKALDVDHDGQVGLYEWDRARLNDFMQLDRNFDGILTPSELLAAKNLAPVKAPSASASAVAAAPTTPGSSTIAAKPSTSSSTTSSSSSSSGGPRAPLTPAKFDADSQEGRMAKYMFGRLDLDKNGSLSQEEWGKSQTTRQTFEKLGAQLTLPATVEQFGGWQIAVQKAGGK